MDNAVRKSCRFWDWKTENNRGGSQSEERNRKRCWFGTRSLVIEDTQRDRGRQKYGHISLIHGTFWMLFSLRLLCLLKISLSPDEIAFFPLKKS